ncbi:phage tail protein I [Desulfurobacterium sp.]
MAKTIELFPPNLREDKNIQAFTEVLDRVFSELTEEELNKLFVYAVDSQPEEALDWLAWQFHVEGYELAQTVEEKRNLVKNAIELHRYKGTKYSIEGVLKALNLSGEIEEWFEYGGEPYKFKVDLGIQDREITPELRDKLLQLIKEYKNERSWLEELVLSYLSAGSIQVAIGQTAEIETFTECQTDLTWMATGQASFAVSSFAETEAVAVMEA